MNRNCFLLITGADPELLSSVYLYLLINIPQQGFDENNFLDKFKSLTSIAISSASCAEELMELAKKIDFRSFWKLNVNGIMAFFLWKKKQ